MLDCPLMCDPGVTMEAIEKLILGLLPLHRIARQANRLLCYNTETGNKDFEVIDLQEFIDVENDLDWEEFRQSAPNTLLEKDTCKRINIEYRDHKLITDLLICLIEFAHELWAMIPGGLYITGYELRNRIFAGQSPLQVN